jgi:hypothetical protein
MRNEQVVEAVAAGARTLATLRRAIYPTLALPLRAAAEMTLKAHAEYLAEEGRVQVQTGLRGLRLAPAGSR